MILVGDCLNLMRAMDANSVEAIVTDPPYHLTTGKNGGTGVASLNPNSPAGRSRIGTGFMGMAWDGGDIAMRPETWAEALRVAKPGAYLCAFGGTRTYHRMACAIEDAGWELRDTLMWVYGSGFPKSHNGEWGGTALKPAWEPIVLARKPLIGTVEANWQAHGTGALNIDGCRVETSDGYAENAVTQGVNTARTSYAPAAARRTFEPAALGRWPANLIHDGSEDVLAAFPDAPGQQRDTGPEFERNAQVYGKFAGVSAHAARGDSDSAARFFYCAKADRADRNDGCTGMAEKPLLWSSGEANPGSFQAEGTKRVAQNNHPTVKPTDLMRWLCRLVTPAGGLVLDPFAGSGSTGRGAILEGFRFIGCELSPEYAAIAEARIAAAVEQRRIDTAQMGLFEAAA